MLNPVITTKFKRDLRRGKKQKRNLEELRDVMEMLIQEKQLPLKYRDHKLLGELKDCRECHVENDWLLVYRTTKDEVTFIGIGSHAELFKK